MRFSLELPTTRVDQVEEFVTAEAVAEITAAAARAGFSAVNVTDHPAPDTRWLDHGGHHALDPLVTLAVAAAADPSILLHTNVFVPAYRNPFLAAKGIQTLDVLSNGRLVLGVAAGYLKPEFAALGADFDRRGAALDDALALLDPLLRGDDVARSGPGYDARGVRLRPVAPRGRPPIWVGGNSRPARRRAARFDGWAPFHTSGFAAASRTEPLESIDDLAAAITEVRALAAEHRADQPADRPFDICWSDPALGRAEATHTERADRVRELAAVGVTWLVVSLPAPTRADLIADVEAFGREVIAR